MGCGCKQEQGGISLHEENTIKNKFAKKLSYLLLRDKNFSFGGFLLSFLITPIAITIIIPFTVILIFSKLTFGKNIDLVRFVTFVKNKKTKK